MIIVNLINNLNFVFRTITHDMSILAVTTYRYRRDLYVSLDNEKGVTQSTSHLHVKNTDRPKKNHSFKTQMYHLYFVVKSFSEYHHKNG